MVAVPVWQTQIQREKEEELIFRGNQYVEAVRLFQLKKPGTFPRSLDELLNEKCIRRLYKDPMTPEGTWNIILLEAAPGAGSRPPTAQRAARARERGRERAASAREQGRGEAFSAQKVLVAPENVLSSIRNAQILGVVSSSSQKSFRVYNREESYDKWLFFYGQDPNNPPEIEYYGRSFR
jgi:hypothetical protein